MLFFFNANDVIHIVNYVQAHETVSSKCIYTIVATLDEPLYHHFLNKYI